MIKERCKFKKTSGVKEPPEFVNTCFYCDFLDGGVFGSDYTCMRGHIVTAVPVRLRYRWDYCSGCIFAFPNKREGSEEKDEMYCIKDGTIVDRDDEACNWFERRESIVVKK